MSTSTTRPGIVPIKTRYNARDLAPRRVSAQPRSASTRRAAEPATAPAPTGRRGGQPPASSLEPRGIVLAAKGTVLLAVDRGDGLVRLRVRNPFGRPADAHLDRAALAAVIGALQTIEAELAAAEGDAR